MKPDARLFFFAIAFAWCFRACAQDYSFTTIAGASSKGTAGGVSTKARFASPRDVALDKSGNVFLTDSDNHAIRKISPDGIVTTVAGALGIQGSDDGNGSVARFDEPNGIAVDASGNLFIADRGNRTVRKISASGEVTTFAGKAKVSGTNDGPARVARFSFIHGIAVDSRGTVYVSDTGNQTIRKITADGTVSTLAGLPGKHGFSDGKGMEARFTSPAGLTVDGKGNVFVADSFNGAIRRISPAGQVTTIAGEGNQSSTFNNPAGVAVDRFGNVFVADTSNARIRKISSAGAVTTVAGRESGTADGPADVARFNLPYGVAVDQDGGLYVADSGNDCIRRISATGVVSTAAGISGSYGAFDGPGVA